MGTKKYRVIIEQALDVEVDVDKLSTRKGDIKYIKEAIKKNPPYIDIRGTDITYSTDDLYTAEHLRKIKFKRITQVAEYKTCPKCKGTGLIPLKGLKEYHNESETKECYRCYGRGEIIKRKEK